MVRVSVDRPSAGGRGVALYRVPLAGQSPRKPLSSLSFAHDLAARVPARLLFRDHGHWCDSAPSFTSCRSTSASSRTTALPRRARLFRRTPLDWGAGRCWVCVYSSHALGAAYRCRRVDLVDRDLRFDPLYLDPNDPWRHSGSGPLSPRLLAGACFDWGRNVATGLAALVDLNDISTSYFFIRQLGNTFGVTAATVLFDHRMTLHSSRLLDVANRLDPIVGNTLSQYATLIHRNAGGSSNPALGGLQLFQSNVITQSRLLSYIDIYFGLAALAGLGLIFLALGRIRHRSTRPFFHLW